MDNNVKPVRRKDLVWREVDGEVIVLSSNNKLMHVLNDVGSTIWALLDGEHDLAEIATRVSTEYGEAEDIVRKDLVEHIEKLRQLNLLEE